MNANDTSQMPRSLSPSILALLAFERVPVGQPEMVRARILARVRALPLGPLAAPFSPDLSPMRLRRLLYAAAAGLALTAGVAAAFQLMDRSAQTASAKFGTPLATPQPPVLIPAAATGLEPTTPKAAEPAAAMPAAALEPARGVAQSRRPVLTGKREGGPEELQLLSRARQSDVRGDYVEVLTVVAEHERSYPAGRLSEEREVLRVKALVGLGRGNESRHAAANFRRQFPRSVLLQKINDLLTLLP